MSNCILRHLLTRLCCILKRLVVKSVLFLCELIIFSIEARRKKTWIRQENFLIWKDTALVLWPIWLMESSFNSIYFLLKTVNIVIGIWKMYLWRVMCCQTQLQCVSYSSWPAANAWAILNPPTSDQASVYTKLCAASHSASHTALCFAWQVGILQSSLIAAPREV